MNFARSSYVYIITFLTVGSLFIAYTAVTTEEKVALVIHDGKENHVRHIRLIGEFFEELEYEVIEVYEVDQFSSYQANRVVLIYSGHGADREDVKLYLSDGQIKLSDVLSNIKAKELIMMTESCFGGYWLTYGEENRIIITAVQGTYAHELYYKYSPYGIAGALPNLVAIAYLENLPLEEAYVVWRDQIIVPHWETQPGIYDAIEGDVYL